MKKITKKSVRKSTKKKAATKKKVVAKRRTKQNKKITKKAVVQKSVGLFHFRRYKKKEGNSKKRHPKLIVGEDREDYKFMGLTESEKKGHHKNIDLDYNPRIIDNKGNRDPRPAFIRKELRTDKKRMFGEPLTNYSLVDDDKQKVKDYLSKRKKR